MRELLGRIAPTHFVTLAINDTMVSPDRMRSLLRRWDARVNRMMWIAFPEKLDRNPHWHLVLQILDLAAVSTGHSGMTMEAWAHV